MMTQRRTSRPHQNDSKHSVDSQVQRRSAAPWRYRCSASSLVVAWLLLAGMLVCSSRAWAADSPARQQDLLLGEWWTEGREGRIKFIRATDGTYRGITTCCANGPTNSTDPDFDIHNPNPTLRTRSTLGIVIIWKLSFEDGKYLGGYVYNPRDGRTYRMKIEVVDRETIEVRGYVGLPLLGQTQTWKRARTPQSLR